MIVPNEFIPVSGKCGLKILSGNAISENLFSCIVVSGNVALHAGTSCLGANLLPGKPALMAEAIFEKILSPHPRYKVQSDGR